MKIDHSALTAPTDQTMATLQNAQRQNRFESEANTLPQARKGGHLPVPKSRSDNRSALPPRLTRGSRPQFKARTALQPVDSHPNSDDNLIFQFEPDTVAPTRPDASAGHSAAPQRLLVDALILSKPFSTPSASGNVHVPRPEITQDKQPSSYLHPASFYAGNTNSRSRELYNPFTSATKASSLSMAAPTRQEKPAHPVGQNGYDDDLIFQFDEDVPSRAHPHHGVDETQQASRPSSEISASSRRASVHTTASDDDALIFQFDNDHPAQHPQDNTSLQHDYMVTLKQVTHNPRLNLMVRHMAEKALEQCMQTGQRPVHDAYPVVQNSQTRIQKSLRDQHR